LPPFLLAIRGLALARGKSVVKKAVRKKSPTTKAQLEKSLRGAKSDAKGLRYEQHVANYFMRKGWRPRHRVHKYGYEYDLYAKRSSDLEGDEYLVVECKCAGKVSAKDVVRFSNKVDAVYKHFPTVWLEKPTLYAYLCYSESVDGDASAWAKRSETSVKLLRVEW
jgi:hypothetical protein